MIARSEITMCTDRRDRHCSPETKTFVDTTRANSLQLETDLRCDHSNHQLIRIIENERVHRPCVFDDHSSRGNTYVLLIRMKCNRPPWSYVFRAGRECPMRLFISMDMMVGHCLPHRYLVEPSPDRSLRMMRLIYLILLPMAMNSKSLGLRNSTVPARPTTSTVTKTTPISASPSWDETTVAPPSTATAAIKNDTGRTTASTFVDAAREEKPFEFQSNFSRNNDSVFVSLHSSASAVLVSINNTFNHLHRDPFPSEIRFHEQIVLFNRTNSFTNIAIRFNDTLTRDMAMQLGDRLIDMAELLSTIHALTNQTDSGDNHWARLVFCSEWKINSALRSATTSFDRFHSCVASNQQHGVPERHVTDSSTRITNRRRRYF